MELEEIEKMVLQWASDRNILSESNISKQLIKLQEELDELKNAIVAGNLPDILDGIGDMLVVLSLMAFFSGTRLFECYARAYLEIKDRKGKMVDGLFVKEGS